MMRRLLQPGILLAVFSLSSCSDKRVPAYNPDIGPFDEDGNYIEDWADNPPKREERKRQATRESPAPRPVSKPTAKPPRVEQTTSRPVAKPKPKPKPVAKPKPKPVAVKPKFTNHRVQKGDTLYSLARRYGTSVSAIQKANGLRGSNIRLGQTLKIPK